MNGELYVAAGLKGLGFRVLTLNSATTNDDDGACSRVPDAAREAAL